MFTSATGLDLNDFLANSNFWTLDLIFENTKFYDSQAKRQLEKYTQNLKLGMEAKFSVTDQFFTYVFHSWSEMVSQEQWFYGCFIHRSPQSPDIPWKNILYFSLGITAIWSDHNLDLFWRCPLLWKYAKLYFNAKYIKKGLNRRWWNVWCPSFQKSIFFSQYRMLLCHWMWNWTFLYFSLVQVSC